RQTRRSCHCGAVRFNVLSSTPLNVHMTYLPLQLCTCSICRKVGGVGGSINLGAHSKTLEITQGKEHIRYVAVLVFPSVMICTTRETYC
ncbi:hypothetical protein BU15DRAFT_27484, partial [Melanogaster broomeanus]